ncbi:MAG: GHKL domain-containing protein [Abyssibacter sp.]|nr:ATP-binding protein [Abyssibacter sp.]MCK5860400.1 GHKL domain-containing protein [Abyssibacter sp.]
MFLRKWIAVLAVLASIALLTLLVVKSQERPLDARLASDQLAQVNYATRLTQQFSREIARTRITRDTSFAALDGTAALWTSADERLARPETGLAAQPETNRTLNRYLALAAERRDGLAEFKAAQLHFIAAFARLRIEAEHILASLRPSDADQSSRTQVMTLLDELASYGLQANPNNGGRIYSLMARMNGRHPTFEQAARDVRAAKDELQPIADALTDSAPVEQLNALGALVRDTIAVQDARIEHYTLALAAFAGALLLVFSLIGLRLRGSFNELDGINANLEKLVEERTDELNRTLQELRMQQAHLIQSEKLSSLGQMVAGVAHEINTPLGYALSNVETVKESIALVEAAGGLSEDAQERVVEADVLLEDSMHGMHQIDELVKSLKNFSRMDRSTTELFNLNDGLDTALKICQNQLKGRVEIERDFAELPAVLCAPSQINQVFLNLINNGAQAIEGTGLIRIETRHEADQAVIRISDSGCGMDEETRAHIFEPFFTTKAVGEGTGLGLSIVFRIIEDHGGRITVDSTPGNGSEFTITLPVRQSAASSPVATFAAEPEASLSIGSATPAGA